jgi:signal transduction histidine kinase
LRSYKLSDPELRARFDHHADSDSIETVRAEVVLLRTLIDERLSLARTEADKIAAFQVIHPAISTLNKLVESLCKLEKSTHLVLGKEALNRLTILIEELSEVEGYTDIIDRVAGRIAAAISESRNTD